MEFFLLEIMHCLIEHSVSDHCLTTWLWLLLWRSETPSTMIRKTFAQFLQVGDPRNAWKIFFSWYFSGRISIHGQNISMVVKHLPDTPPVFLFSSAKISASRPFTGSSTFIGTMFPSCGRFKGAQTTCNVITYLLMANYTLT